MVDVTGHIIVADVDSATPHDSVGGKILLEKLLATKDISRLKSILADGAYSGELQEWFHRVTKGKRIEIAKKSKDKGFHVIAKRWIVERTFAWFGHFRRLSKDYEYTPKSSLTHLFIADTILLIKKLTKPTIP